MGGAITPALSRDCDSIFEGEHLPDSGRAVSAEQHLWAAVLARCWLDAFVASDAALNNTDRTRDPVTVRQEGRRWLVTDLEPWRGDRETVCVLAEISEPMLRRAAKRRLELAKAEESTAQVISLDRAFAALLEEAETMDGTTLDAALAELAALETAA